MSEMKKKKRAREREVVRGEKTRGEAHCLAIDKDLDKVSRRGISDHVSEQAGIGAERWTREIRNLKAPATRRRRESKRRGLQRINCSCCRRNRPKLRGRRLKENVNCSRTQGKGCRNLRSRNL
jgi:hypothetical protein